MSDSLFNSSITRPTQARSWMMRLVFALAFSTLFLMALGSATRVMNAGLSCPDWPLCYGEIVPREQMNLEVFLEWFHRDRVGCDRACGHIAVVSSRATEMDSLGNWICVVPGGLSRCTRRADRDAVAPI
jgi:Cytochrome oxidase assembly protein